jgi:hypothetical protein
MYFVLEFCDTTLDKQRDELSLKQYDSNLVAFFISKNLYL